MTQDTVAEVMEKSSKGDRTVLVGGDLELLLLEKLEPIEQPGSQMTGLKRIIHELMLKNGLKWPDRYPERVLEAVVRSARPFEGDRASMGAFGA